MGIISGGGGGGAPTGAAGGVLGGTYPNPAIALLFGSPTIIAPDDASPGLAVAGHSQNVLDSQIVFFVEDDADNTDTLLSVYHGGEVRIGQNNGSTHATAALTVAGNSSTNDKLTISKSGIGTLFNVGGAATDPLVRVATPAVLVLSKNAAPADAALSANDCALWFDPSNGVAALNIKAKQADGTVKTATIPVIT